MATVPAAPASRAPASSAPSPGPPAIATVTAEVPAMHLLHDLTGKVAVVTGAGSGIGRAAAVRMGQIGARVLCVDLDEGAARATAGLVGDTATGFAADVCDGAQLQAAAARAVEAFGRIDVLVNSAGVFPPVPTLEMTAAQWDHVLDINARGTLLASQACAPHMQVTGGGAIVNIASKSAYQPTKGLAHYAASKGAVVMLTKALALELSAMNIRVNAVAPGGVQTEGAARTAEALLAQSPDMRAKAADFAARCPMGRNATPDEIARIIVFLATDWSSYMTGSTVLADGGYLLT